ncbi:MAG TPA: class I SAM-dependent methyltransferase [Bacteroidota bacterium]|nr:class I SAM-dependent methyltransferase [Bacteroidota bacterium]
MDDHNRKYWQYEYDVSARFIVPLLDAWGRPPAGASILDVGCGEGGGLCALHDRGGVCAGFDVEQSRVATAIDLQGSRSITFACGDLYADRVPFDDRRFDLVTLHDVFEHLDHKPAMIERLKKYLAPGGKLLITFPPYYSAYGGHQQHLRAWFARLPFFHLVPFAASKILPDLRGEVPHVVAEVQKLARLKMGMRQFERVARECGMRIDHRRAYLISPNHIRFGLRPLAAGPLARVPVVREFVCTGVVYLLSRT